MGQVRRIYRELERELTRQGFTARQRREEWQPVEDAISAALGSAGNRSDLPEGQAAGQAALEAARRVRAKWIPDID